MNSIKVFPGHRSRLSALFDLIRCMNASTLSLASTTRSLSKTEKRPPKNE
jgi:hypothetical protein